MNPVSVLSVIQTEKLRNIAEKVSTKSYKVIVNVVQKAHLLIRLSIECRLKQLQKAINFQLKNEEQQI